MRCHHARDDVGFFSSLWVSVASYHVSLVVLSDLNERPVYFSPCSLNNVLHNETLDPAFLSIPNRCQLTQIQQPFHPKRIVANQTEEVRTNDVLLG